MTSCHMLCLYINTLWFYVSGIIEYISSQKLSSFFLQREIINVSQAYSVSLWAFHGLATNLHEQCLLCDLHIQYCTVKKGSRFSCPQPRCHLPNSAWPGIIKLFPARESLVSDIPAEDGKISNLFYSVYTQYCVSHSTIA